MQQECPSKAIMTRRARFDASQSTLRGACRVSAVSAPAPRLPDDAPVVENLDRGNRRHRRAARSPARAVPRNRAQGFEPNASPSSDRSRPTRWASASCSCGSRAAGEPGQRGSADRVHRQRRARSRRRRQGTRTSRVCASSPYKIPTPWIAMFYFRIDADIVARLGRGPRPAHQGRRPDSRPGRSDLEYVAEPADRPASRGIRRPLRTGQPPFASKRGQPSTRTDPFCWKWGLPPSSLPNYLRVSTRGMTTCVPARRSDRSVSGLYWRSSQIGRLLKRWVMVHSESPRRTI